MINPSWTEEIQLWQKGYQYICGVDEVGRGAWAGPVVSCAVIFSTAIPIKFPLRDSKTLSRIQRERIFPYIQELTIDFAFGEVPASIVDQIGIMAATFQSMRQAIRALSYQIDYVLVDGRQKIRRYQSTKQKAIIKGDQKSYTIAAASVLAKVYRDRLMLQHHQRYSNYGFDTNVGYGTQKHQLGIQKFGLCELHRKSFVPQRLLDY